MWGWVLRCTGVLIREGADVKRGIGMGVREGCLWLLHGMGKEKGKQATLGIAFGCVFIFGALIGACIIFPFFGDWGVFIA
jgi:hypothetical protein